MKIGILEAGRPPFDLADRHGTYPQMVREMLGSAHSYAEFCCFEHELPSSADSCHAFVVTGSAAGVHDGLPWIGDLLTFLREARGQAILVGICFGHQLMAEAFGGAVGRSKGGWELGLQHYHIEHHAPWMDPIGAVGVLASHQDQVTLKPATARVLAKGEHVPFGMFEYDGFPAISFQCHPEFTREYLAELISTKKMESTQRARAIASLSHRSNSDRLPTWIRRYMSSGNNC